MDCAMSNRYPRRNALAGQQSKPGWKYHPSNDNLPGKNRPVPMPRRPPLPMNDNIPGRLPKAPAGIPPKVFAPLAGRMLSRGLPLIGWALTAWDLYSLYRDWKSGKFFRPPIGWVKVEEATGSPAWWDPGADFGGTYSWTGRGYLTGNAIRIGSGSDPGTEDIFPTAPHYWWKNVTFSISEPFPHIAVESVWYPDWDAPLLLPPKEYVIPFISPIDFPGVTPFPHSPQPVPVPVPVRFPKRYRPYLSPNSEAGYGPALKPYPAPNGVTVQARRPKRKEKERKVTGSKKHLAFLGWILSQYSEIGDLVDAFNDALPDEYKSDGNMKDKLKNLYQHWDKVQMDQAVANMVEDMVTDPKFAGVFEEMQERQEEFGLDLGGLKGLEGSSGIWPTIR